MDLMSVEHNVANADVLLGGIFDIRNPGEDGYGCGAPHPGKIVFVVLSLLFQVQVIVLS